MKDKLKFVGAVLLRIVIGLPIIVLSVAVGLALLHIIASFILLVLTYPQVAVYVSLGFLGAVGSYMSGNIVVKWYNKRKAQKKYEKYMD
jgi:hypothetical protein